MLITFGEAVKLAGLSKDAIRKSKDAIRKAALKRENSGQKGASRVFGGSMPPMSRDYGHNAHGGRPY